MSKKNLTPEQKYKKNQKKAKVLKRLSPILFWGFLVTSIVCLFLAIKNSFGNIAEIIDLLDSKRYNGEELRNNYDYLIAKYGEWVIGTGGQGFTITFVNVGKALFSGLMILNCFLFVLFLISAFLVKWILPKISDSILADNQDMVNLTVLKQQGGQDNK